MSGLEEQVEGIGPGFVRSEKRRTYSTLNILYLFRSSRSPHTNDDAACLNCKSIWLKAKSDRLFEHAFSCRGPEGRQVEPQILAKLVEEKRKRDDNRAARGQRGRLSKKSQAKIDVLLLRLICANSLPFSITESHHLKVLLKELNCAYQTPSRKRMAGSLLQRQAKECRSISRKNLVDAEDYSINIEFDCWAAPSKEKWLAICLTHPDGRADLIELVNLTPLSPITYAVLAAQVIQAVRRTRVAPKKLNAVISDDESASKKARHTLISGQPAGERSRVKHMIDSRCMAHFVNLIIEHLAKSSELRATFEKLRDLIWRINHCGPLAYFLKARGTRRVVNIVPTRWYSACNAIKTTLGVREALLEVPDQDKYNYSSWSGFLDDLEFWQNLRAIEGVFSKLSKLVGLAEARTARLSEVFAGLLSFAKYLLDAVEVEERIKVAALRSFLLYFHKLDLDLVLAAYILDPNQRYKFLTEEAVRRAKLRLGIYLFEMGYDDASAVHMKHELINYEVILKAMDETGIDCHAWWSDSKFTFLKALGLRLNSLVPNSANTERVFSALNLMITSRRTRLDISTVFDAISLKIHATSRVDHATQATRRESFESSFEDRDVAVEEALDDDDDRMEIDEDEGSLPEVDADIAEEPELEREIDQLLDQGSDVEMESQQTIMVEEGTDVFASRAYTRFIELIQFDYNYLDVVEEADDSSQASQSSVSRAYAIFG